MFWQSAAGGVTSTTVTIAVHVEVFPLWSVAVKVTVFAPTFEQLNEEGVTLKVTGVQTSKLPLSTCAAVIETVPEGSRFTVMF